MKIELFDIKEFIDINELQEITSPILFQRGNVPHPNGLISNEIFGVTTKSRRETYAYIDLHGYFFNPHILKAIRRMFRNIDKIISGEMYCIINSTGHLEVNEEIGETGLDFLYKNWEKINWSKENDNVSGRMREERVSLLENYSKNEIFMRYQIVIPAFYRDIKSGESGGGETDDINNLYARLIRLSSVIKNQSMFEFQFHTTNYNIQSTIIDIYDYFKHKLEKKKGLIRKYLMGKNVDYCTRTVITAPTYHANSIDDLFVNFEYSSLPISQVCSLAYPFVIQWVKAFFEKEVVDTQYVKVVYDAKTDTVKNIDKIKDAESYFSDKYIKKLIDTFIKDPESRFTPIKIPTESGKELYLVFTGKRLDSSNKSDISGISSRPMTWTDLLYMACEKVTRDKHVLVTRYPVSDEFGLFITKIRVASTATTIPVVVNGYLYKWYPNVDLSLNHMEIAGQFIDSCQFSNSYLDGIGGDYDGDQTTMKIIYTQEANEECEQVMNRKSNFINAAGSNIRTIGKEAKQTYYVLTKDPCGEYRRLTLEEKQYFLSLTKKDLTFENFVNWFGDTVNISDSRNTNTSKSKYNVCDVLVLSKNDYPLVKSETPIETTLGRLIFNKVIIESLGFDNFFEYQNSVITSKEYSKLESRITELLKNDEIIVEQMKKYVDTRDWFGLQLHTVITSSFTPNTVKLPKEVIELKKKLMEENKEALSNNDIRVMEKIEKELIEATKKILEDDVGLDLYNSGARGSVNNHLKNILLTRGASQNPTTKEYKIIENSLMDGLAKKDIGTHSNAIVSGAYPKSVETAVSGYMSKELLAAFQGEVLGPKGSDCGSLRCIKIKLTEKNFGDYLYRYIKVGNKYIMLSDDNKSTYIGKEVNMRSPLYCIGTGKEKCMCNICAGDYYYILEKPNIGLTTSKCGTTITNLNMKKFHENLVTTKQIDINDMLI